VGSEMRVRLFLLTAAPPLLGFAFALVVAWVGHSSVKSEVAACVRLGCFDSESFPRWAETISPFIRGSEYEGRLNINKEPQSGSLNVYIAKTKLPGSLAPISCNCAYVGSSTVVCDKEFLLTFQNVVNFTRASVYGKDADTVWTQTRAIFERVNERVGHVLQSWILGHEIAHAILHAPSGIERHKPFTEQQELEADQYFMDRSLVGADKQQIQNLSFGLTQFIFAILGIAMNGPNTGVRVEGKAVIAPSADGVHPRWLIRALKLGQRISDRGQAHGDRNDFYDRLADSVVVRQGGLQIGSICALESLRELEARLQEERLGSGDKHN
jgi:hypothetical protein